MRLLLCQVFAFAQTTSRMVLIIYWQVLRHQCMTTLPPMTQSSQLQYSPEYSVLSLNPYTCRSAQQLKMYNLDGLKRQTLNLQSLPSICLRKVPHLMMNFTCWLPYTSTGHWAICIPTTWQHVQGDSGDISDASIQSVDILHDMCCTHAYLALKSCWKGICSAL